MELRKITKNDIEFFYNMKCDPYNIFWTGWDSKPKYENIVNFINDCIKNENNVEHRKIYIVFDDDNKPSGYMYIVPDGKDICDIPVAVVPGSKVNAKYIIEKGLEIVKEMGFKKMIGYIREDNVFSLKAYKSNGVQITDEYIEKYIPMLNRKVKMYKTIKNL